MRGKQWAMILGLVAVVALATGAEVRRASKDAVQDTAAEVAFGTLDCAGSAIGTVTMTLDFPGGTSGIVAAAGGLKLSQIFDVEFATNEEPGETCQATIESLTATATGAGCAAGPVRAVGNRRTVGLVCGGDRTATVQAIDALGRAVLGLEF